ncbi:quinoprotein dehydrogenase-associated SoxYZ-like carrier [Balneatrix alpica]|uniref:Quinoprotein dehydrogenase-associated SoxYZ-like carrier n=1 Tax=Balneatrix alpica TaxID=75684 RepID=A0ABV5ZDG7_9GAMM|nr:quinoprotein dehydrogenase-associated SoxYZ-like carrier [Balneatrix alpica]
MAHSPSRMLRRALSWLTLSLYCPWLLASPPDPLNSVMWDFTRKAFLGAEAPYEFSEAIQLSTAPFAENATQVPISIDASQFAKKIIKMQVWAELNPLQHILTYEPLLPMPLQLSVRIKVQQSTPVRAAILADDGRWYVGSTRIDAHGGGCTAPRPAAASQLWQTQLGQIQARLFPLAEGPRLKLRVIHPMDTGLVNNIPEFYLQSLEISDQQGPLARLQLNASISPDPVFTLSLPNRTRAVQLALRDNNGNEFHYPPQGGN